jgi:hypothetical protein
MKGTPYLQICAWVDQTQAASASPMLSTPAIIAVATAVPVTIFVIAVCALAWRSVGLPPAGQAHTLKLMDRLANIARSIWPKRGQRSKSRSRRRR